jgi:tetratricopeptide (TPR) repeat protein
VNRGALAVALLSAIVAAQEPESTTSLRGRLAELARQDQELVELQRLHAAGGSVAKSRWVEIEPTAADRADARKELLRLTEAETRALREQLVRLEAMREERRRRQETVAAGDTAPLREELGRAPRPVADSLARVVTDASVPLRTVTGTSTESVAVLGGRADATVRIQGSTDRRRVGHALMRAGVELRRAARALALEGRAAAAAEMASKAHERFEAAKAELTPLVRSESPDLHDLFALAQCEEQAGNFDEADRLYAELMALDRRVQPDGSKLTGSLGRAAATARSVLAWTRDSGPWRPRRNVDEIRLPRN